MSATPKVPNVSEITRIPTGKRTTPLRVVTPTTHIKAVTSLRMAKGFLRKTDQTVVPLTKAEVTSICDFIIYLSEEVVKARREHCKSRKNFKLVLDFLNNTNQTPKHRVILTDVED